MEWGIDPQSIGQSSPHHLKRMLSAMSVLVCTLVAGITLVAHIMETSAESNLSEGAERLLEERSDSGKPAAFGQPDYVADRRVYSSNVTSLSGQEILARPFASRIIVSEKSKLIYCPIPKAASSNWKYLIRKFEGLDDYFDLAKAHSPEISGLRYLSDYSAAEVERLLADPLFLKFTFVRDPYSRAISCYLDRFQNRAEEYVRKEYRTFLAELFDWHYAREIALESEPRPSFSEFIDELAKQSPSEMNAHWAPQSLLCGLGEMPFDFIGHMNTLSADVDHVLAKLGHLQEHFPSQSDIGFPASGASTELLNNIYTLETMLKVRFIFDSDFNHGLGSGFRK
jgi:hypothetical protein